MRSLRKLEIRLSWSQRVAKIGKSQRDINDVLFEVAAAMWGLEGD